MTRKHFVAIAAAVKATKPPLSHGKVSLYQWEQMVDALVGVLRGQNPRFNADRFRRACGKEDVCTPT